MEDVEAELLIHNVSAVTFKYCKFSTHFTSFSFLSTQSVSKYQSEDIHTILDSWENGTILLSFWYFYSVLIWNWETTALIKVPSIMIYL